MGIHEIRHVEGLYAYWDYLRERFPGLLIDNCAGGGRRLDLETMSRSAPLWRTDYSYGEVNGYQCHTYGLNFYLPIHGTGLYKTDPYSVRSALGSAAVLNWKLNVLEGSIADMQQIIAQYKELRPYYYEDYYPLTGTARELTFDNAWLAYQMHRPSDQSGIVVAFRRKDNQQGSIRVRLRGVDPAKTYRVLNDNDGTVTTRSARSWPRASTCRSPRRRARCCCAIRKQGNKPASAPEIVGEPSFRKRRTKRDALPERAYGESE